MNWSLSALLSFTTRSLSEFRCWHTTTYYNALQRLYKLIFRQTHAHWEVWNVWSCRAFLLGLDQSISGVTITKVSYVALYDFGPKHASLPQTSSRIPRRHWDHIHLFETLIRRSVCNPLNSLLTAPWVCLNVKLNSEFHLTSSWSNRYLPNPILSIRCSRDPCSFQDVVFLGVRCISRYVADKESPRTSR